MAKMAPRILCVAEKNSIAKAVAEHLSGGEITTRNTAYQYIKNYSFNFDFGRPWGRCEVTMTSVSGHLMEITLPPEFKNWQYPPPDRVFNAPIRSTVPEDKLSIAQNIEGQARFCQVLYIWTDCDLEGEHIGDEIRQAALKGNPRMEVKRARFSNIEKTHILEAARRPTLLDERQVAAVATRSELDFRTGVAFTRFLTNTFKLFGGEFASKVISYGSCQFPTLGFVVDRYFRVKNFVPEQFWGIKVVHERDGKTVTFSWARGNLFDRMSVIVLYERCLVAKTAEVTKVQSKPTSKWKPLPLTTLEFQKMATKSLRMTGHQAMEIAEKLYQKGFISYPRTETDQFDKEIDLRALVRKQQQDGQWGQFATDLMNGGFQQPRNGRHNDKAHPPIHPITYVANLEYNEKRVYEFIVRRFLACCSQDAKGKASEVEIAYGHETFNARGVIVLERNYLDVYPYENWTGTTELPNFTVGERFEPTEATMTDGKTSAPSYLTEADLLALMDANGIGTDATMAEHIKTIQTREYVVTRQRGAAAGAYEPPEDEDPAASRPGRGRGGRGRGRGRGGRQAPTAGGGRGGVTEFIPTSLGVALIQGFDRMNFETSLGKPFLRKEMEAHTKDICAGRMTPQAVLQDSLSKYREVYDQSQGQLNVLKAACREYMNL